MLRCFSGSRQQGHLWYGKSKLLDVYSCTLYRVLEYVWAFVRNAGCVNIVCSIPMMVCLCLLALCTCEDLLCIIMFMTSATHGSEDPHLVKKPLRFPYRLKSLDGNSDVNLSSIVGWFVLHQLSPAPKPTTHHFHHHGVLPTAGSFACSNVKAVSSRCRIHQSSSDASHTCS